MGDAEVTGAVGGAKVGPVTSAAVGRAVGYAKRARALGPVGTGRAALAKAGSLVLALAPPPAGGDAEPATPPPPADPEAAVESAYRLVLGRRADPAAKEAYAERLRRGETTLHEVCVELATSAEFAERLGAAEAEAASRPTVDGQEPGSGPGFVDVRELLADLSVEELAEAADDYYRKNLDNPDYYLAKPLANVDEAPDLLACFAQVLAVLRPLPGMVVVDFGAGTAWSSRYLTQLGCEVVAVDVSPTALALARVLFERLPVVGERPEPSFSVFDGHRIDLPDESCDRVFCFDALHHVPNPAEVLAEMGRVLKPGGAAGFVEPGPNHSKTAQSQFEMRNYTVVENDVVMGEVWAAAQAGGFTKLELAVFTTAPFTVSLADYEDYLAGGPTAERHHRHVLPFAASRRIFFLSKGEGAPSDSRDRQGLLAALDVRLEATVLAPGRPVRGTAHAANAGTNHWLPSDAPAGPVRLGVHLYGADGKLADRDFARVPLPGRRGVRPGAAVDVAFELPGLPEGRWRLEFDLVAENVAWFEINGSPPAAVDVVVG